MNEPGSSREQLLIKAFVGLADTLVDDYDIIDLLDRLVTYSVQLLAADAAGILLADAQGNLRVVASTNEQTEWMEMMQLEADEGPCVECFRTGAPVTVTDLTDTAERWPRLVAALGDGEAYRSVHGHCCVGRGRVRAGWGADVAIVLLRCQRAGPAPPGSDSRPR